MPINDYVEQTFPVECKGRDFTGEEVLETPVKVDVQIHKSSGSSTISSQVNCPYNTGAHGQRCKAAHPNFDKGNVICPYSFDIPYALEKLPQVVNPEISV